MKSIMKQYKHFGYAQGPIESLNPLYERNYGMFFTILDEKVQIGFVFYIGKSFISFWWLK